MNTAQNTDSEVDPAYGMKFERGLDITEIAKRVRADIKAAIKTGTLPAMKASVTVSRYAGGQSLNVKIKDCPAMVGKLLNTKIASIKHGRLDVDEYNFDKSDTQSDYFHVNFYGHVDFCHEFERVERVALQASLLALAQ